MSRAKTCLLLLVLGVSTPAAAHHSLAGYDAANPVSLDGVVAEFHFTQPHPFLILNVGAAANRQTWKLEMDNLRELRAVGVSVETFRAGDRVQVSGSPSRDGARAMYLRRLDRARDGLRYEQVGMSPRVSFEGR